MLCWRRAKRKEVCERGERSVKEKRGAVMTHALRAVALRQTELVYVAWIVM